MSCVVYEASCREHGKRYIGQSKDFSSRVRSHNHAAARGSKSLFHRAVRKYGIDGFDFRVRAELPTVAEAKIAEMLLIATERPEYNMSAGGDGAVGVRHSAEWCARQRATMLGREHTPETKEKIRSTHLGRVFSPETREKMRQSARQRDPAKHPMLGRAHSAETRAKISATKRAQAAAKKLAAAGENK